MRTAEGTALVAGRDDGSRCGITGLRAALAVLDGRGIADNRRDRLVRFITELEAGHDPFHPELAYAQLN